MLDAYLRGLCVASGVIDNSSLMKHNFLQCVRCGYVERKRCKEGIKDHTWKQELKRKDQLYQVVAKSKVVR